MIKAEHFFKRPSKCFTNKFILILPQPRNPRRISQQRVIVGVRSFPPSFLLLVTGPLISPPFPPAPLSLLRFRFCGSACAQSGLPQALIARPFLTLSAEEESETAFFHLFALVIYTYVGFQDQVAN